MRSTKHSEGWNQYNLLESKWIYITYSAFTNCRFLVNPRYSPFSPLGLWTDFFFLNGNVRSTILNFYFFDIYVNVGSFHSLFTFWWHFVNCLFRFTLCPWARWSQLLDAHLLDIDINFHSGAGILLLHLPRSSIRRRSKILSRFLWQVRHTQHHKLCQIRKLKHKEHCSLWRGINVENICTYNFTSAQFVFVSVNHRVHNVLTVVLAKLTLFNVLSQIVVLPFIYFSV